MDLEESEVLWRWDVLDCYFVAVINGTKINSGRKSFIWYMLLGHSQSLKGISGGSQCGAEAEPRRKLHMGSELWALSLSCLYTAQAHSRHPTLAPANHVPLANLTEVVLQQRSLPHVSS